jgi:hypothetical protein
MITFQPNTTLKALEPPVMLFMIISQNSNQIARTTHSLVHDGGRVKAEL